MIVFTEPIFSNVTSADREKILFFHLLGAYQLKIRQTFVRTYFYVNYMTLHACALRWDQSKTTCTIRLDKSVDPCSLLNQFWKTDKNPCKNDQIFDKFQVFQSLLLPPSDKLSGWSSNKKPKKWSDTWLYSRRNCKDHTKHRRENVNKIERKNLYFMYFKIGKKTYIDQQGESKEQ